MAGAGILREVATARASLNTLIFHALIDSSIHPYTHAQIQEAWQSEKKQTDELAVAAEESRAMEARLESLESRTKELAARKLRHFVVLCSTL